MPNAKTILVVEDEVLIAMAMAEDLREADFEVLEAYSISEAQQVIASGVDLRMAILDLDLNGQSTAPLAEQLRARGVPFLVCSGSQIEHVAEIFANAPIMAKPFRDLELMQAVSTIVGAH